LRDALEAEALEAIDLELHAAQSLALDPEMRGKLSHIAELILMADFKQAAEAVSALVKNHA
jgi:predicted transcriptional regulator